MVAGGGAMAIGFVLPVLAGRWMGSLFPGTIYCPWLEKNYDIELLVSWTLLGPVLGLCYALPLRLFFKRDLEPTDGAKQRGS